jgi:hypothetical protein
MCPGLASLAAADQVTTGIQARLQDGRSAFGIGFAAHAAYEVGQRHRGGGVPAPPDSQPETLTGRSRLPVLPDNRCGSAPRGQPGGTFRGLYSPDP